MFDAYYSRPRWRYLDHELRRTLPLTYRGDSAIKKTGCFYGPDYNWYVDTSDGVNEDLPITEYAGRMLRVIADAAGKPFLFFKCSASPERTRPLAELAAQHGGQVIPFMQWPHNRDWFAHRTQRDRLAEQGETVTQTYDVGLAAGLTPYYYPRPDQADPRVSWHDRKHFGLGAGHDTGFFTLRTRHQLHDQLQASSFTFDFTEKVSYRQYLQRSLSWRAVLCPPGMGEYTQRIFDHGPLGQCLLLRRSSYDFGLSWKPWLPEVDFAASDWAEQVQTILDAASDWAAKAEHYFATALTPAALVSYLTEQLDAFAVSDQARLNQLVVNAESINTST